MVKKFITKIFFVSSPIILLVVLFIIFDPFRVARHHDDYYAGEVDSLPPFVTPNRDYVSSELYINNRIKYNYNSFIFGSSRTLAYDTKDWKKHLDATSSPFLFDAMSETIFGMYKKIEYIDKTGGTIKNCIILIDGDVTFNFKPEEGGHLYLKHPTVAGSGWFSFTDWPGFYAEFLKSYFDPDFLWNYYKFIITRKRGDDFSAKWIVWNKYKFDLITNDMILSELDAEINNNPEEYYRERAAIFYQRDSVPSYSKPGISEEQTKMMNNIKEIFNRQNTDYKIVISPLYSQVKFNNEDLQKLISIFGKDRVFNFSGKNQITSNIQNYYENSHYRKFVGDLIMNEIYLKSTHLKVN